MSQAQLSGVAVKGNPLDSTGRCILSLDGGGVRGYSTLMIIKDLMAKVNFQRAKEGEATVRPCELFDLIGGTSTGGIIAIMLGRLEMDVDECLLAYASMFDRVFKKKGLPTTLSGDVKGRFDSIVLQDCVREILRNRGLPADEPLLNSREESCKVVVVTKSHDIGVIVLFRSYLTDSGIDDRPTICEAVAATSAASSFFDAVIIGPDKKRFVDGAIGANNPVDWMWNESQRVWCDESAETYGLASILKCFVSIGTGQANLKAIGTKWPSFLKTLKEVATETEETAKKFAHNHTRLRNENRYFRFNVDKGLQDVGLAEYEERAKIASATQYYMDDAWVMTSVKNCTMNLKQKQHLSVFRLADFQSRLSVSSSHTLKGEKPHICIPFEENSSFVARPEATEHLLRLLPFNESRSAVIWGLGGCGKTQMAMNYAYNRLKATSCSVCWVYGATKAKFFESYSSIARQAGLSQDLGGHDLYRAVVDWIAKLPTWLMVIDNVDDLTIFKGTQPGGNTQAQSRLRDYVPRTGQYSTGSVLWTSRDQSILGSLLGLNAGLELGRMNDSEARELLGGLRGPVLQNADADHMLQDELIHLLESLPLAIAQAAAYIRIRKVTIERYVGLFRQSEEKMQQLLSVEFDDKDRMDIPNAVMKTWMISMDLLSKEDPLTRQILMIVACLDRENISFKLLQTALTKMATQVTSRPGLPHCWTERPGQLTTKATDPSLASDVSKMSNSTVVNSRQSFANNHYEAMAFEANIQLAASRLVDHSLLSIQNQDEDGLPVYEQHRLVHLSTKYSMKWQEKSDILQIAINTLGELCPEPHFDNFWEFYRIHPHVNSVRTMAMEDYGWQHLSLPPPAEWFLVVLKQDAERWGLNWSERTFNIIAEDHPEFYVELHSVYEKRWSTRRVDFGDDSGLEIDS